MSRGSKPQPALHDTGQCLHRHNLGADATGVWWVPRPAVLLPQRVQDAAPLTAPGMIQIKNARSTGAGRGAYTINRKLSRTSVQIRQLRPCMKPPSCQTRPGPGHRACPPHTTLQTGALSLHARLAVPALTTPASIPAAWLPRAGPASRELCTGPSGLQDHVPQGKADTRGQAPRWGRCL